MDVYGSMRIAPRWVRWQGQATRRSVFRRVLAAGLLLAYATPGLAGPPFSTDDPEPVDFGHNEFYAFGTLDHADGASAIDGPAFEYNRGIAQEMQLHIVVPMAWNVAS